MRYVYFSLAVLIATAVLLLASKNSVSPVFTSETDEIAFGSHKYGQETMVAFDVNGSLELNGTVILGNLIVNGYLSAKKTEIGFLEVNGAAELKECKIISGAIINGALEAEKSIFQKELSIAAETTVLRSTTAESIIIRQLEKNPAQERNPIQILELRDGTRINGSISFESGEGEVIISADSEIIGDVKGGKVRNLKTK